MQFDLTFDLFAWVLLILLALLFCQFWPGGQRASAVPKPPKRKRAPKPFAGYTHKPECDAICETGSGKRWQPQTLAMAAGLTDRVWSLKEVLMSRVPPWLQSQMT